MASEKETVALVSIAASGTMAAVKFAIGWWIGSLALIADALHSLVDLGATVVTFVAIRLADRPADHNHPFGHGKFESVAALAETMLLFALAGGIAVEAVQRLWAGGVPVAFSWIPFAVLAVEMAVNGWRVRAMRKVAAATKSPALASSSLHFLTDLLGSVAVMFGLALSAFGHYWGDALGALMVAVIVIGLGLKLGARTLAALVDTAPKGLTIRAQDAVSAVAGVASVERLRVRPVGATTFADVAVVVSRTLPLDRVADIRAQAAAAVAGVTGPADVTVEVIPTALDDETMTERVLLIARNKGLAIHHVTLHRLGDQMAMSLDLEVDGTLPLGQAHDIASSLEDAVRAEFGSAIEVETHIEPLQSEALGGQDAPAARVSAVATALTALCDPKGPLCDIHNVRVRATASGDVVNFHCRVDPALPVEHVHRAVDELERGLRRHLPDIARAIGHAEPLRPALAAGAVIEHLPSAPGRP
jgi:cation diffusion facilitator family transporter